VPPGTRYNFQVRHLEEKHRKLRVGRMRSSDFGDQLKGKGEGGQEETLESGESAVKNQIRALLEELRNIKVEEGSNGQGHPKGGCIYWRGKKALLPCVWGPETDFSLRQVKV